MMTKDFYAIFSALLFVICPFWLCAQKWDTLAPIPASFTFPVVDVLDGKIHIMGGGGASGATDLHYAYDPATDTWSSRTPVPYKAQQPAGAAANGKIHFFGGGFPNSGTPLKHHFIYDPSTDSWTKAPDLTAARAIHYAVTLDDVVYSLAGQGMTNLCQTYDPVTNTWTTKNNLPDGTFWYGAHVATEGHIYRFCGGGYTAPNNRAHRYDPVTDSWTALPTFPTVNHGLRGAAIGDKIFLAGGYHDFLERTEVRIFDTKTNTYSTTTPLPLGRNYHNMVALDSCLYVVGGNHAIDQTVRFQLLRFCPFQTTSVKNVPAEALPLTARFHNGKILVTTPEKAFGKAVQLSVFDLSGKLLKEKKIAAVAENDLEIEATHLPKGIFFVRLQIAEAAFSGKVAIQ